MARREKIATVGSPFEADAQLIALMNQNIIQFVLSSDSDIPFQGCSRTILKLQKTNNSGPCYLVQQCNILADFKTKFHSNRELNNSDLSLFACLLGNDYIDCLKGSGPAKTEERIKVWMGLEGKDARTDWLQNYVELLEEGNRHRFYQAMEHWVHAPAYWIVPNNTTSNTCSVVFSQKNKYTIKMSGMDGLQDKFS